MSTQPIDIANTKRTAGCVESFDFSQGAYIGLMVMEGMLQGTEVYTEVYSVSRERVMGHAQHPPVIPFSPCHPLKPG